MNFFKKFFGFGSKSEPINSQPQTLSQQSEPASSNDFADDLLKGLFVDNTPPPVQQSVQLTKSRLQEFMQADFSTDGFKDGYTMHTMEFLHQRLPIIRATFRQIIDEAIDSRKQEIYQLVNQKIETLG